MNYLIKFWGALDGLFKIKKSNFSHEIIDSGQKKLAQIKKTLSFIFIFICFYSIEQCSPGDYSFYNSINSLINKNSTINSPTKQSQNIEKQEISIFGVDNKYIVKISVLFTITFIFYMQLSVFDKTQDQKKLRSIINEKYKKTTMERTIFRSCFNDLKNYALSLASNSIENLCNNCIHKKCNNKISAEELTSNHSYILWRNIYNNTSANPERTEALIRYGLYVRFFMYLKILLVNSIIIVGLTWVLHRGVEFYLGQKVIYFSQATIALALMIIIYVIMCEMGKTRKYTNTQSLTGIWSNFEESGKLYFRSPINRTHLEISYKENICSRKSGPHLYTPNASPAEINASIAADLYNSINENIDELIIKKLASIIEKSTALENQYLVYVGFITSALKDLFDKNFSAQNNRFQVSYASTQKSISDHCAIIDKHKSKLLDEIKREGVYFCWNGSTEKYIIPSDYKSFFICNIGLSGDNVRYLRSNLGVPKRQIIDSTRNLGYIILASSSGDFFSDERADVIHQIIKSYILRMAYEIIRHKIGAENG